MSKAKLTAQLEKITTLVQKILVQLDCAQGFTMDLPDSIRGKKSKAVKESKSKKSK